MKDLNLVKQLFKLYLEAWRVEKELSDYKFEMGRGAYELMLASRFPNKTIDRENNMHFLGKPVLLVPEMEEFQVDFRLHRAPTKKEKAS